MWKTLATCLLLFAFASCEAAEPPPCQAADAIRFSGPDLSIPQMEAIGLKYAARNPKAPQVPFAYGNKDWLWLKAQYRSGDRFVAYEQLWPPSGKPFAWGYALVRGQCVIGLLGTRVA